MATTNHTTTGELRTVALSTIDVREGFNPRSNFEHDELQRLTRSIERRGMLTPVVLTPAGEGYALVDGERRLRAAAELGLMEIPAIVRATDEQTGGLEDAVVANYHRAELTIVEEALAFRRLLDLGLTKQGVAEELSVSRRLVTDRLELLKLPEALRPKLDDGSIPPGAVKALTTLAAIHPELPAVAVAVVESEPAHAWEEPPTWTEVAEDPIAAVTGREPSRLPDGIYEDGVAYAIERFSLSEKAGKDLAALRKLEPRLAEPGTMEAAFGSEDVEAAEALGAAHRSSRGYSALIVGDDVAAQLAGDYVAALLKRARQEQRRRREVEPSVSTEDGDGPDTATEDSESAREPTEGEVKELRRQEREVEMEARRQAIAYNAELGAAVLKHLGRVRVDAAVLKVLSAVDLEGELGGLASRGARYGFPGWPVETTTKGGKAKVEYPSPTEARERARTFLEAATSVPEIAGRSLCLVVMARYANEECVAQSNRSFYSLRVGAWSGGSLPWAGEVIGLIERIAEERLPDHLTVAVREERERREQQAEQDRRCQAEAAGADAKLRARLPEMTVEERSRAVEALREAHGRYVATWELQGLVQRLNEQEAAGDATVENPNDEEVTTES